MNNQSQQALQKIRDEIWFDLETTGLGTSTELRRLSKIMGDPALSRKEIGIWQIAFSTSGINQVMYGKTDIPFEEGAEALIKDQLHNMEKGTEKQLVEHFGKMIKEKPGAILTGYNIGKYDIPVMAQAFERYGMHEELNILKNMTINDVQLTATKFLDSILTETAKFKLGLNFKENAQLGTKLENMAEALGVLQRKGDKFFFTETGQEFKAHYAPHDITLTKMVQQSLRDPIEASKRFSMEKWIESVDRSHRGKVKTWKSVYLENALNKEKPLDLFKEVKILDSNAYKIELSKVEELPQAPKIKVSASAYTEAKQAIKEVADDIAKSDKWSKLSSAAKKAMPSADKALKWGLIGGMAYLGYKGISSLTSKEKDTSDYISASVLGRNEDDILRSINNSKTVAGFNKKSDSFGDGSLKSNKQIQKIIEDEFEDYSDSESAVEVQDDELGIKGSVDAVVTKGKQKIPIEVKSIGSFELESLEAPKEEHASQVNFYAHALNASGGYVVYADRDQPKNRKTFYVPYAPGTLIRDVANFRSILLQNRNIPNTLLSWGKQSQEYWESETVPTPQYGKYMGGSKTKDQRSKNAHLFPVGQNSQMNHEENGSRYHRRN